MKKNPFVLSENTDGGIGIHYSDAGVGSFGGSDYEVDYSLDAENTEKLTAILEKNHTGDLKQMLIEEFGECLDKGSFSAKCDEWEIKYSRFTWID